MGGSRPVQVDSLYRQVRSVLEQARSTAYRAVNFAMVGAYWQVGGLIVEHEQRGRRRAVYGEAVLEGLSQRLTRDFGRGFDVRNLRYMRQFYLAYRAPLLEGGATGAGKRNALRSESEKEAKRNAARSKSRIQRTAQGELPGLRPELSWSHYRLLLGIEDPAAREWYMNEAASQHWSTRQLDGGQWLDPDLPGLKLIHRRLPAA